MVLQTEQTAAPPKLGLEGFHIVASAEIALLRINTAKTI